MICHLTHAFALPLSITHSLTGSPSAALSPAAFMLISVCWRSNFSSENYDMLPCVIPFRKYVYTLFFLTEQSAFVNFSSHHTFFSPFALSCLLLMPLLTTDGYDVCLWCSADVYCEFSHIFLPYTHFVLHNLCVCILYLSIHKHTFTYSHSKPITRYRYDRIHEIPSHITMVFVI